MYKIFIIKEEDIKNNGLLKIREKMIKTEYDLIYCREKGEVKYQIISMYNTLPKMLSKLAINNEIDNTYINPKITNKIIDESISEYKFENKDEENILSYIVMEILENEDNIEIIGDKAESKGILVKNKIIQGLKEIVKRNYNKEDDSESYDKMQNAFLERLRGKINFYIDNM